MTYTAYAAPAIGAKLEKISYEPEALGANDVEISVSHCGICHSDVHLVDNDWGISSYPLVPGHEVVGKVVALGSEVTHLNAGDRVGIGWLRSACLTCEQCLNGDENLCANSKATCVGHHGGFATGLRLDSRFAFKIPATLASENAAPLLCGGITVYAPLVHFGVKPSDRVGVIGIGGLGHLALQFAKAFGCEVTAFTSSKDKSAEAKKFGAHHVIDNTDPDALADAARSLDFIISTAHADLDWTAYLKILKPNGKLCLVGVPSSPITIPIGALLGGRKSICASPTGGRHLIEDMLNFAARHNIQAQTEVVPIDSVNTALDKTRKNQARYRMVLKCS